MVAFPPRNYVCDLPLFAKSFVMGVVSAQREVLRFAGMGVVQKSPLRRVEE